MPIQKINDVCVLLDLIANGTLENIIVPSKRLAFDLNRKLIEATGISSQLEGVFLTCEEYLAGKTTPVFPKLDKGARRLLIYRALKSIDATYFKSASKGVIEAISEAISQLKKNRISPSRLEEMSARCGSYKEYDLLRVYKKYEELLAGQGAFDDESIFLSDFIPSKNELSKTAIFGFEIEPLFIGHFFKSAKRYELSETPEHKPNGPQKIVICNSPLDEARFIVSEVEAALSAGISPDEIQIVLQNKDFLKSLLAALVERKMVSDEHLFSDVKTSSIFFKLLETELPKEAGACEFYSAMLERLSILSAEISSTVSLKESGRTAARALSDIDRLKSALEKLAVDIHLTREDFLSLLEQLLEPASFDETKLPFKIVSMFDAAICRAQRTIIAECHDGNIPAQQGHLRFFQEANTKLEKVFPLTDELLKLELKYFRFAAAGSVVTCALHSLDGGERNVSPFIAGENFEINASQSSGATHLNCNVLGHNFTSKNAIELLQKNIRARTTDENAHRPFSITRLENFGKCPFKYFCEIILEISPPDDRSGGVLPKDRGTIIHSALEYFFKSNLGRINDLLVEPNESLTNEILGLVNEAAVHAFNENTLITDKYDSNIIARFKKKTLDLTVEVILQELDYLRNCTQRPAFFEERLAWQNFAIEGLSLMGYVDRIDIDDGTFSILDYKTGETKNVEKKIEQGLQFQLPLYCLMAKPLVGERSPAGMFLYAVKKLARKHGIVNKELAAHCVGKNKISKNMVLPPERVESLIEHAVKTAEIYVRKIFNGEFSGEPQESNCSRSCEFKDVCRFRD